MSWLSTSWPWFLASLVIVTTLLIVLNVVDRKGSVYSNKSEATHPINQLDQIKIDFPVLPSIEFEHDVTTRMPIVRRIAALADTEIIHLQEQQLPIEPPEIEPAEDKVARAVDQETSEARVADQDVSVARATLVDQVALQTPATRSTIREAPEVPPLIADHRPKTRKENGILCEIIELILYINIEDRKRSRIEKQINNMFLKTDWIDILRVKGEKRNDIPMGNFLSHLTALSLACSEDKNVCILEDDFEFFIDRPSLEKHLKLVQTNFEDRWNVIALGQFDYEMASVCIEDDMELMRLLRYSSTLGYIVNRTYLPTLVNILIEHLYSNLGSDEKSQDHLMKIQQRLQSQDTWLGFKSPIGGPRNWNTQDFSQTIHPVQHPKWTIQDVGVCVRAHENSTAQLNDLLRYLYLETHKGHRLHIAVIHPPHTKVDHRHHRRSSSNAFEGVKHFTDPEEAEAYLKPYQRVQVIDAAEWSPDVFTKMLKNIGKIDCTSSQHETCMMPAELFAHHPVHESEENL